MVNNCNRCIYDYKHSVISAVQQVNNLKKKMKNKEKLCNKYAIIAKEIAIYAKEYEKKFEKIKNELFSLDSISKNVEEEIVSVNNDIDSDNIEFDIIDIDKSVETK